MPRVLQSAVQHAVTKKGVSVVVCRATSPECDVEGNGGAIEFVTKAPVVRPSDADLGRLADLLNKAQESRHILRKRMCRGARRSRRAGRKDRRAGGLLFPRQGMDRAQESERRRHDGSLGLGLGLSRDARLRCLALIGDRFSLRGVHAHDAEDRTSRHSARTARPTVEARYWAVRRRRRHAPCLFCRTCKPKPDRTFLDAMLEKRAVAERKLRDVCRRDQPAPKPIHPESVAATIDELGGGRRHLHGAIPECVAFGRRDICTRRRVGGFWVRSTTVRWPTPCPRRSARRSPIPTGR